MTERFIVVAPPYSRRNSDIHALHKLCDSLGHLGYWARIAILDGEGVRSGRAEEFSRELNTLSLSANDTESISSAIVVYPDTVAGNILGSSRAVWYLLNPDGLLTGRPIAADASAYFVAGSMRIGDERARTVLRSCDPHPALFADPGIGARPLDLTYGGTSSCPCVPDSLEIGLDWPMDPAQFAQLLRLTRYVYTWDPRASLNIEAILCGARPIVMRWAAGTQEAAQDELAPVPLVGFGEHVLAQGEEWKMSIFLRQRRDLIARIRALQASWDDRVHAFAEDAISHFKEHGL